MPDSKPRWRVLIGSRSFGQAFPEHLTQLAAGGCEVVPNGVGRAYHAAELLEVLPEMDAIVTGTDELTAEVINAAPRLRTIAKHGVGLETIDLAAARARGISVSYTPGFIHDSVADLALALLLALARKIVPAHLSTKAGSWKPLFGVELRDKTLGIVGLGRIGKAVCERAKGFGMQVIAYDPYPDEVFAAAHNVVFVSLPELLQRSDIVSLHAPAEATEGPVIGPAQLDLMKPTAFLINTARGQLVDEAALADALREGRLAGAGIDAFVKEPPLGSPLLELDNVVLTPHLGGRTLDGQRRMGELVIENCLRALRGEAPLHQVG
ncbi:MAG: phosphoglycerate dehydrogenase [Anaerolineales bacterium]|nr:phosphoglycerate dehydrogenase [Anaerolineales bacterium]